MTYGSRAMESIKARKTEQKAASSGSWEILCSSPNTKQSSNRKWHEVMNSPSLPPLGRLLVLPRQHHRLGTKNSNTHPRRCGTFFIQTITPVLGFYVRGKQWTGGGTLVTQLPLSHHAPARNPNKLTGSPGWT